VKDYLQSIVGEQISRAIALKEFIPKPLQYSELTGLAERCTHILNEQADFLRALSGEIGNREEDDLHDLFREARVATWEITLVEYYGLPALYNQTPEAGFLNKIVFQIHREIALPILPPAVCCVSTDCYSSVFATNVIFVPISESRFLLHLPDLYHEIGHCVLESMKDEPKLKPLADSYQLAFSRVTDYYNELKKRKKRDVGPPDIPMFIERIHSLWRLWLGEFFCDLFALYTVGPAYAWSHLHLTAKRSEDIYKLAILEEQDHPADEARMRILLSGLKLMGFAEVAKRQESRWSEIAVFLGKPQSEYQYAFPQQLLEEVGKIALEGVKGSGFSLAYPQVLDVDDHSSNNVRLLLNDAWNKFWDSTPDQFRDWERRKLEEVKRAL
jgi:hypothetical protein